MARILAQSKQANSVALPTHCIRTTYTNDKKGPYQRRQEQAGKNCREGCDHGSNPMGI